MSKIMATEMIAELKRLVKKYGDLPVVYSIDDEGNNFQTIYFTPSPGIYEDYDFRNEWSEDEKPNAICVN